MATIEGGARTLYLPGGGTFELAFNGAGETLLAESPAAATVGPTTKIVISLALGGLATWAIYRLIK